MSWWWASSAAAFISAGISSSAPFLTHAVVPDQGPHVHQVDHAPELPLGADGQLDHGRGGVEAVLDHLHAAVEVGAGPVHLVDEAHPGHGVLVGLPPHRLGLGLDPGHRVENGHGSVEHPKGALDLDGEVDVAGGVDDVDAVSRHMQVVAAEVMVMPRSCSWTIQSMVAAPAWTSPIL